MNVTVRARDVSWNSGLQRRLERRLGFALGRHRRRIHQVRVHLADTNGPRGGKDKLCRMTAIPLGTRPVTIVEKGARIPAVLNRAAGRLGYRVGQELARVRRRVPRQAAGRQAGAPSGFTPEPGPGSSSRGSRSVPPARL